MRRLALLSPLLLVACTRPNPAFDGRELSDGSDGDGDGDTLDTGKDEGSEAAEASGDGDGDGSGDGDGESESESSTGDGDGDTEPFTDLPEEPLCPWQPSPGLAIRLGSPADFGGQCPTTIEITAKFEQGGGGEASLAVCGVDCQGCDNLLSLSAYPLSVTNYFPNDPGLCLNVNAETSLGGDQEACYWGSLSVRDWATQKPYVIATAHSSPPPVDTLTLVDALVPEPVPAGGCECGQIGLGDNGCCLDSDGPEFWYYPILGQELFPGDFIELQLPNANLPIYFKVFQAERIADCNNDGTLQTSWVLTTAN